MGRLLPRNSIKSKKGHAAKTAGIGPEIAFESKKGANSALFLRGQVICFETISSRRACWTFASFTKNEPVARCFDGYSHQEPLAAVARI